MVIFEEKIYFWLFWIIPIVLIIFLLSRLWRKRAQKKFATPEALAKLSPEKSRFKPVLKFILFALALSCFIMALVNPKAGSHLEKVKRKGVDVVFAVDVSKSMLAEDVAPNRLERSKRIVQQIIDHLKGDRVGIIAYAGSAIPQLPITTDYGAARMFLGDLNTDMLSSTGTAIAQAIDLSLEYYDDSKTSRVLILVTDGEDHEGEIDEVAKEAAEKQIRIFTIGVGTTQGGRIPIKENGVVRSFKKDAQGQTVITKMDPKTLQEIAKLTKGDYAEAENTQNVVKKVGKFLDSLQKSEIESEEYASFKSRYQWFLGLGIFFIVIEIMLLEKKAWWLNKWNLFNEN